MNRLTSRSRSIFLFIVLVLLFSLSVATNALTNVADPACTVTLEMPLQPVEKFSGVVDLTSIPAGEIVRFIAVSPDSSNYIVEYPVRGRVNDQLNLYSIGKASSPLVPPPECQLDFWDVPPDDLLYHELSELTTNPDSGLALSAWVEEGVQGHGVKIGVIDSRFDGFEDFMRENDEGNRTSIIPAASSQALIGAPEECVAVGANGVVDRCSAEVGHGTKMLRTLTFIAPEATYYVARISNNTDEVVDDLAAVVEEFINLGVNIVVHSSNYIPYDPSELYEIVSEAVDYDILWINSAGNMAAGYLTSTFAPGEREDWYAYNDPNRQGIRGRTIPIPVDIDRGASVTLRWVPPGDDVFIGNMDISVSLNWGENAYRGSYNRQLPENDLPAFEFASLEPDFIAGIGDESYLALQNDQLAECFLLVGQEEKLCDGIPDNEIFVYLPTYNDVPRGSDIELYVMGAIPAQYDVDITDSLAPVVLVPGDMDEVLTVGAYDWRTETMAWYSSRSNRRQFVEGNDPYVSPYLIKPDITTYGEIILPNGDRFFGTSASTPIIGAVAALIADWMMDDGSAEFDPDAVRAYLTDYNAACLQDGTLGRQIRRLDLLPPAEQDSASYVQCGTYPEGSVSVGEDPVRFGYAPPRVTLTPPQNDLLAGTEAQIEGVVNGSGVEGYFVQIAPSPKDGETPEWELLLEAAPTPETQELIANLPDDICQLSDVSELMKPVTEGTLLVFNSDELLDENTRRFPDGAYTVRLSACIYGSTVAFEEMEIGIQNETDPTIILENRTTITGQEIRLSPVLLEGIAGGRDAEHYVIQMLPITPEGELVEGGTPINVVPLTQDVLDPENVCAYPYSAEDDPTWEYGAASPLNKPLTLLDFDQLQVPDGHYRISITLCGRSGGMLSLPNGENPLVTDILVNLDPAPFIEILRPNGENPVTGREEIIGRAGGDNFTRYILSLEPVSGDSSPTILIPEDAGETDPDIICSNVTLRSGASEILEPNTAIGLLDPSPFEAGDYILRGYVCANNELVEEATVEVELALDPQAEPEQVAAIEASEVALKELAPIFGTVDSPNFEQFIVQIMPTDADDAEWTFLVPEEAPEVVPPDNELCSITPPAEGQLGSVPMRGVVARVNTADFLSGAYSVRILLCETDSEAPALEQTKVYSLFSPVEIQFNGVRAEDVLSDRQLLRGTIRAAQLDQYVIELLPEDQRSDESIVLVGPTIPEDAEPADNLCAYAPAADAEYGTASVTNSNLAPPLDARRIVDGTYTLHGYICRNGQMLSEQSVPNLVFSAQLQPRLVVDSPENGSLIEDVLTIQGSVYGSNVRGYTVEISQDLDVPIWTVLYPAALSGVTASEDLCAEPNFPRTSAPVINDELLQLETTSYLDSQYLIRVTACIRDEDGNLSSYANPIVRQFRIVNETFSVGATGQELGDRIDLIGTVIAPADFEQYIIEMALQDTETTIPEERTWLKVVGPTDMPDSSQAVDLASRCAYAPPERGFGSYPVLANSVIGVIQTRNLAAGTYDLRISVCLSSTEDREFFVTNPPIANIVAAGGGALGQDAAGQSLVVSAIDGTINLRQGPGVNYPAAGTLSSEQQALVSGRSEDSQWLYVQIGETNGWVPLGSIYVRTSSFDLASLTIVSAPDAPNLPSFSSVYYASDSGGSWQIYRSNTSGQPVQLTSVGNNEHPDYSPVRQQVVFASDRDGNREIYVMGSDGSTPINVTNNPASDYRPMWAPNGSFILFESDRNGTRNLYSLNMTTGVVTAVTSAGGAPCCVDWSPDGTQFVFASRDAGTYDLYLATMDGSYVAQLTRGLGDEINPVWNPRGNVIVFQSVENGVSQLFTIRTNGEEVTQLTNSGNNVEPSWSADGQVILFSTNRNGQNYEIYAMNADGSNQRSVSGTGGQNALGATPR